MQRNQTALQTDLINNNCALPGREGAIDQRPVLADEGGINDSRLVRGPTASATAPIRSAAVEGLIIWLCGAVVGMLALVRSVVALLRLRQSVQPLCGPAVDRTLAAARALLKTKRSTEIAVSKLARAPLAAGLMRPIVILPATLIESISPAQLREVLLHELAHIERRDNLVALAQLVARSLFWPIPFVHLLNRRLERAREEVCDNYVLACSDAVSYGETLLRVASLAWDGAMPAATVGILHWRGKLEDRIAGLIDTRRTKMTRAVPRYV